MKNKLIFGFILAIIMLAHSVYIHHHEVTKCGIIHKKITRENHHRSRVNYSEKLIMKWDDNTYYEINPSITTWYSYNEGDRLCFEIEDNKYRLQSVIEMIIAFCMMIFLPMIGYDRYRN